MIALLLQVMGKLGELLVKALPLLFAYKAGSADKHHDFDESVRKILEEDNEELRAAAVMPPSAKSEFLRARAAKKRKDQD